MLHISYLIKTKEVFLEKLQITSHMDIDQYVLFDAVDYKNKLMKYKNSLNIR